MSLTFGFISLHCVFWKVTKSTKQVLVGPDLDDDSWEEFFLIILNKNLIEQ